MSGQGLSAADADAMRAQLRQAESEAKVRDTELTQLRVERETKDTAATTATTAQQAMEVALRGTLAEAQAKLEASNKETLALRARVAATQFAPPAHTVPVVADGLLQLLKDQAGLENTQPAPGDKWPELVQKMITKGKPKNGRGEVILKIEPLRIAHPDIAFVPEAWPAIIDLDTSGSAVELLNGKIKQRYPFSDELTDELGFLLLSVQRTCHVTAAGATPSDKLTALSEVIVIIKRRVDWLEKRLLQKTRPNDSPTPTSPPKKNANDKKDALRGEHW